MKGAYLIFLVGALGCLALIDRRLRLAWWYDVRRTVQTLVVGILFFLVWDIAGILLHIFFIGDTAYLIGIQVGQFPLEELFFLALLCYSSLLAFRWFEQREDRR